MPADIILASTSKTRKLAMDMTGIPYRVIDSQVDEEAIQSPDISELVLKRAKAKARAVSHLHSKSYIIAADTMVMYRKDILGKPIFKMDAVDMLKQLSDTSHVVYTGWVVRDSRVPKNYAGVTSTRVFFRNLSDQEILNYVNKYPVTTWAAGYNALDNIASSFITKIQGSYTGGIYGLPLEHVIPTLQSLEIA